MGLLSSAMSQVTGLSGAASFKDGVASDPEDPEPPHAARNAPRVGALAARIAARVRN